jgi:hypothetical protein
MPYSSAEVMAVAEGSPAAAGARDRTAWLGLFTADGYVEDPVGSQPHRGHAAMGRFFDTFIAPRDVAYLPDHDIVTTTSVIRDGVLQASLGRVVLRVPIYIRYEVREDGGELKIAALRAFWELPTMVVQFLRGGIGGVRPGLQLARLLIVNQGLAGTLGFLRGFRGAGRRGKRAFGQFLVDAQFGDEVAVRRRLAKGAQITDGDGPPLSSAQLASRLAGGRQRKLIASGNHLVVGIEHGDRRDILIAEVTAKPFTVSRLRLYAGAG